MKNPPLSLQLKTLIKSILKKGDRVGVEYCGPTRSVFTFDHWDGIWMVSKSGRCDYHPYHIYSINGESIFLLLNNS